jgi:phosphoribosyl 1,2-cyclic phosphodiesterase
VRLVLCGVRGSTPAPGHDFADVGGHTSCVAVCHDHLAAPTLVLDAGTGIRAVTSLMGGAAFDGTILLGHLHWDHTQGLPFFQAGLHTEARTRVMLPEQGSPAVDIVARFLSPPAFPVEPLELRGLWSFDSLDEGVHSIEGFEVLAREIPHKGGRTFGFRVSDGRGTFAYLSDHGPLDALGPGPDGWGPYHESAMALCEGADLLIHDAQYTVEEMAVFASYGHASGEYAVELARRCDVPSVLLFHHEPSRTDHQVAELEARLQGDGPPHVVAAREGMVVRLPPV